MIEFGVAYYPQGAWRECSNEAEARDCFANAPQGDDQTAVLIVDWNEVERREPDPVEDD